ncbi:amino acid ABC transporter permease [Clostridium sp. MB40-C1]|uniref:amino acid ABC transporter permease n=1 Tax=Clostridium sp. MB40-C1 TaxID=3070996 RepID=UPI0027DF9AEF|nr:amino acid ABC transporter permease [Clostridium sp. MB40-C1]WMJ79585.1 amino acid ABC transporter permease [Clostridium sp. MB40-C1]
MDVTILKKAFPILLKGSIMTIELTVIAIIIGTILAMSITFCKISNSKILKMFGDFYTWFFRGTPLLIQLFVIYYGFPQLGIKLEPFAAAIIGLTINISAYITEIIRASIQSIDKGQWEASKALGMNYWQTMFLIIIPQSIKRMLPPMSNEFIALLKDTSLVSAISMGDLMRKSQLLYTATYKPLEIFLLATILYLLMTTIFTTSFKVLENRFVFE